MITKNNLLEGLYESIHIEEGMVTMFTNFDKALVNMTEGIGEDKKKKINNILTKLYNDSTRHKEVIYTLITDIKKEKRNEY
ncbi:MAG: hypothetical protein ABIH57_01250 [Candidatus Omnitrophota bacterium]